MAKTFCYLFKLAKVGSVPVPSLDALYYCGKLHKLLNIFSVRSVGLPKNQDAGKPTPRSTGQAQVGFPPLHTRVLEAGAVGS